MMEKISIGQYRSHDPPKNFAVRVKFSKVTPESAIPSATIPTLASSHTEVAQDALELVTCRNDEEDNEELVIHWQEKLFSRREFEYYCDPLNCINSLEQKYHEDVETIKRTFGERQNKRIFTYVDCDKFPGGEALNSVTLTENEPVSALTNQMLARKYTNITRKPLNSHGGLRRRGIVATETTEAMKSSHVITTPNKHMHIMVDLSPKTTSASILNNSEEQNSDERILCTIKIDANGLIVMKPDIVEKEVFKLEVYHDIRSVYNYSLADASVVITKSQKSQEANLYRELYNRHAQLMQVHVGNELTPLPNANEIFMHSLVEIVSAKNFEYSNLYVQYFLELPPGWRSSNNMFGVTQSCTTNKDNIAYFSFPFDFQLQHRWPEDDPDEFLTWPVLYLQVYSLDSWQRHRIEGYGYCQLPDVAGTTNVQVHTWRPEDDNSFSDMRRYFIGGTRELKDFTYVRNPGDNEENTLSKYYFKSVSAGSIVLRINTLLQTKVVSSGVAATSKWKKATKSIGGYATAVDSLSQIMDSFHRARKRMLSAWSTLPVMT